MVGMSRHSRAPPHHACHAGDDGRRATQASAALNPAVLPHLPYCRRLVAVPCRAVRWVAGPLAPSPPRPAGPQVLGAKRKNLAGFSSASAQTHQVRVAGYGQGWQRAGAGVGCSPPPGWGWGDRGTGACSCCQSDPHPTSRLIPVNYCLLLPPPHCCHRRCHCRLLLCRASSARAPSCSRRRRRCAPRRCGSLPPRARCWRAWTPTARTPRWVGGWWRIASCVMM